MSKWSQELPQIYCGGKVIMSAGFQPQRSHQEFFPKSFNLDQRVKSLISLNLTRISKTKSNWTILSQMLARSIFQKLNLLYFKSSSSLASVGQNATPKDVKELDIPPIFCFPLSFMGMHKPRFTVISLNQLQTHLENGILIFNRQIQLWSWKSSWCISFELNNSDLIQSDQDYNFRWVWKNWAQEHCSCVTTLDTVMI